MTDRPHLMTSLFSYNGTEKVTSEPVAAFTTITVSCDRMTVICMLYKQLLKSRLNGEDGGKITNQGHMMSHLMIHSDLLNAVAVTLSNCVIETELMVPFI